MPAAARGRGTNEKPWREAIHRAVKRRTEGDLKALDKLADKLVALGIAGEVAALKEIGDRLDGRPKQETDLTINDNRDPNSIPDAELAAIVAQDGSGDDAAPEGGSGIVH